MAHKHKIPDRLQIAKRSELHTFKVMPRALKVDPTLVG